MSQTNNPCENCTQECPAGGCNTWKEWWVQNWNENIHRNVPTVPKQVWQYEHPDRVREVRQTIEDLMIPGTIGTSNLAEVDDGQ